MADWVWQEEVTAARTVPGETHPQPLVQARETDTDQQNLQAIVARLQREARADARLKGRLLEADLNQLVDQHVRVLWAESRVTAYVPLLAMRRIYEELDLAGGAVPPGEDA